MVAVAIPSVLLAPVADLTQQIELDVADLSDTVGVTGEVRAYAGGRRRSIVRAGQNRTVPLRLDVVADRTLIALLTSWRGQVLLYRDARGRKVYGTFFDLQITETIVVDVVTVSLTLTEVTVSESV